MRVVTAVLHDVRRGAGATWFAYTDALGLSGGTSYLFPVIHMNHPQLLIRHQKGQSTQSMLQVA